MKKISTLQGITYPELFQFFSGYFNQDYDLMVEGFDRNKQIIPQLVIGFKEENSPKCIKRVIDELESLISKNYVSNVLEDILSELGSDIDNQRLGYTNQQFLIEVLKLLKE